MKDDDNEFAGIRIRSRLHEQVTRWTSHWSFGGTVMFCIAFNSVTLAVATDDSIGDSALNALKVLDYIFLAVYTIEFLVKMYVSPTAYFTNGFNLFDFFVLVMSWVDVIVTQTAAGSTSNLSGLRVLRILRTLRALRTISFVPSLQVIVTALMTTVRFYMLNLMVVLFLIMFIFGVMGYYLFGSASRFSSLGESMLSLATLVTLDSWTEVEDDIDASVATLPPKWFCVIFIFVGNYIYTNVFVSVVIVNMTNAQQAYIDADRARRREIVAEKTINMNQKQKDEATSFRLFLEQDQRAKFANYEELVKSVNNLLAGVGKPNDVILCGDTSLNLLFVQEYLGMLEQVDNETFMQKNLYREIGNIISLAVERQLEISGMGEQLLRENSIKAQIRASTPAT
ncbi:putative Cation channel sperm-associated protein 3 [Hypsibius exemplaris]|uniref:Cation channel sperm-associated protein 3 n=1 Tax=Hypsibius exemplaris TaxID=2072580 RepID=A0A1W0WFN7_HYPEX|nr:putative Cation channel sperm-associated protein 3 [Hypsibius exemplaris]